MTTVEIQGQKRKYTVVAPENPGPNLLLLQAGGQAGSPPIDGRETAQYGENIADPLAQGIILSAPWS